MRFFKHARRTQRSEHRRYLGWDEYTNRMATLELHTWQQQTRARSLANASSL